MWGSGAAPWHDASMCGRYVVAYDPETLVSGFSLTRVVPFPRRWNVTPQSAVPVVYELLPERGAAPAAGHSRVAEPMRWGLLPHWAKDPALGHKLNNARAESVAEKPSFRQALRRRRCLLPASGFYEWQASAAGKQPWYIAPAGGGLLAMAGLFEAWRPPGAADDTPWQLTCCVITTEANALMAPIHDRMPVFLAPEDWSAWLARDRQDAADVLPLLRPCSPDLLRAWPVSRAVNRGSAEGEALIAPIESTGPST